MYFEIVVEMTLPVLLHSGRISYHGGLAWCDGIIKYCSRAYQILLKIHFSCKLITGSEKIPQSGVGSMHGKNAGNMPSAVCASSMNKSLDPTPI